MQELKDFKRGGMDLDSAVDAVEPNDYLRAWNLRGGGTQEQEEFERTNIEGNTQIIGTRASGINKCIGAFGFELVRKAFAFISNSQGYNQIEELDYDTLSATTIYENLTDSNNVDILPLDPQLYVTDCKLAQNRYLMFTYGTVPYYVDLVLLRSKSLGAIVEEDFLLLKGQPLIEPTAVYNDDTARSVNLLKNRLFQFRELFEKLNYEKTSWGTISKRQVPSNEPTPSFGTNVTVNNNLIVSVPAGSDRDAKINVAGRYDLLDWFLVKSINRSDIIALPDTTVDVENQIYEAYDPSTNIYSFAFYNDENYENIDVLETDENYDHIWEANTLELINGSILTLGGLIEGYNRPVVDVSISVSSYDPQIGIPTVPPNSMAIARYYNNRRPSNIGIIRFFSVIDFVPGLPKTGDVIIIKLQNIQNATDIQTITYTVPPTLEDNMQGVVNDLSTILPDSATNPLTITFGPPEFFVLLSVTISLANAGSGASRSIHGIKSNSSYQLALAHYDGFGRYFPIVTDKRFVQKTPSYALTHGLLSKFDWEINSLPPTGAATYQWLLSLNLTHATDLFINGSYDASRSTSDYLVFNIKSLKKFNDTNSSSILNYEYSSGDRCTFLFTFVNTSTPIKWFDTTAIDVEIVGFEIVVDTGVTPNITNYFLKVRKSSSLSIGDLIGKEVLLELYSPKKRTITTDGETSNAPTLFFEIGERYNIVGGDYSVKQGSITEGDNYFKTRGLTGNIDPNVLYYLYVEDFNFSDFYKSDYTSYGRPRSYDDERGRIELPASIRNSQTFITGGKENGINRFYGASIYGDGPGETSSVDGRIGKLRMRGRTLICIQELDVWHIPVSASIIEDLVQQRQVAISEKLLNSAQETIGRYGIGTAKESYAESQNGTIYFIDPNNSLPIRDGYDGLKPIPMKMSKYFRRVFKQALRDGKKIISQFDVYNNEWQVSIEDGSGVVISMSFNMTEWDFLDSYDIDADDLAITVESGGDVLLNGDGTATFTPDDGYTGTAGFTFTFLDGATLITKNSCGEVIAGTTDISSFFFIDLIDQELSTLLESNSILITGNNIPVPISIVGGQYSINGGAWTSSSGTVSPNASVKVRGTSSGSYSTMTSVTLTVSGYSDSFDITTKSNNYPDPFTFVDVTNAVVSTQYESNVVTISGIGSGSASISVTGGEYKINAGAWTSIAGTVNNTDTVQVRGTSSSSPSTMTSVVLTVGSYSDSFDITTVGDGEVILHLDGDYTGTQFDFAGTLGETLSLDLTVNFDYEYNDSTGFHTMTGSLVIIAGMLDGSIMVGSAIGAVTDLVYYITSVSPNPNGGKTIIF